MKSGLRNQLAEKMAGEITLSDSPGLALKKWRQNFEIAPGVLSDRLGVSPSVISDYESGRRKSPGTAVVGKIVDTILSIDEDTDGKHIQKFSSMLFIGVADDVILDIHENTNPIPLGELTDAIGCTLLCGSMEQTIFGYTVINSLNAILQLSAEEFNRIYGWSPSLVAIVAAASTIVVLITFLHFWKPKRVLNAHGEDITHEARQKFDHSAGHTFNAWMPWLVLSVVVFAWGLPQINKPMDKATTIAVPVEGLHLSVSRIPPVVAKPTAEAAVYKLNWLAATGTGIFIAAILSGFLMGLSPIALWQTFIKTVFTIRFTVITIAAMLALGFITRYCGLDATMGLAFARTGALYPFFGTLIGWLGTATTGSDTSSNVLFGSLQKLTAQQIGVSPILMASANSAGGVMGKMIDAQSIVVASTATQQYGQEGSILRFVFWHSLGLAALAGGFVYLLAYVYPFSQLVVR